MIFAPFYVVVAVLFVEIPLEMSTMFLAMIVDTLLGIQRELKQ